MKKVLSIALTLLMLVSLSAVAFAADDFQSPGADDFFNVIVEVKDNKGGNVVSDKVVGEKGEEFKIVAKPDSDGNFSHWIITGEFEWVKGDANSAEIVIRPLSNVTFTAVFDGGETIKDNGSQSPVQGYDYSVAIAVMAAVIVLSAGAVVYTGKKCYTNAR